MKKLNILFKRICAISLSSALFLGSVNASAFTAGRQGDATIDIEDIEIPASGSGSYMEENITFDGLDPETEQEDPAPIQEVDTMDDFQQEIVELNQNTDLESDNIYASKRLIVISDAPGFEAYNAENILAYGNLYVLSYASESETRRAYNSLSKSSDIISVEVDSIVETSSPIETESMEEPEPSDNPESLEGTEPINDVEDKESIDNSDNTEDTTSTTVQETEAVSDSPEPSSNPSDIKIAVIDSGIDKSNPLFEGKIIDLGFNFSTSGDGIQDDNGHGTAVASIIAKNSDAYIMPIKIANSDGKGTVLSLYLAIQAAIENEADIINLSMTTSPSELLASVIEEADQAGIKVVAAAGNQGANVESYAPANIDSVIAVAAVGQDYSPAPYSNYGSMIDYAAVGTDIKAEALHGPEVMSGTSLSAAYVSAVMAYAIANGNSLDGYVYPVDGKKEYYGNGIVSLEEIDTAIIPEKPPTDKDETDSGADAADWIFVSEDGTIYGKNSISLEAAATLNGITYTYASNKLALTGSGTVTNAWQSYNTTWSGYVANVKTIQFNSTGITGVDGNAFEGCTALATVTITKCGWDNTASSIDCFKNMETIKTVTVAKEGKLSQNMFEGCTGITSLTITSTGSDGGIDTIPANCFKGCSSLTAVTIPKGIKTIGAKAFDSCSALATVTFTATSALTSIGNYAFNRCSSLTNVKGNGKNNTLPDTVQSIGNYAFADCTSLETLNYGTVTVKEVGNDGSVPQTITSSLQSIGTGAFSGCTKLSQFKLTGTTLCGCNAHLLKDISYIGNNVFSGTAIKDICVRNKNAGGLISSNQTVRCYVGSVAAQKAFESNAKVKYILWDQEYNNGEISYAFDCVAGDSGTGPSHPEFNKTTNRYNGIQKYEIDTDVAGDLVITALLQKYWSDTNNTNKCSAYSTILIWVDAEENGPRNEANATVKIQETAKSRHIDTEAVCSLAPGHHVIEFYAGVTNRGHRSAAVPNGYNDMINVFVSYVGVYQNGYAVDYKGNGATGGSTKMQSKTEGESITIQQNGFTRTGYIFTGWNTKADGTGTAYAAGAAYSTDASLTLYAQWKSNSYDYTVQFNANGGTGSIPSAITKSGTDSTVVMGNIGSSVPTRSGYTFKGWSAASTYSSSNKRIAYSSISGATTTSSSWCYTDYCIYTGGNPANRTLTLYAQWEPVSYSHTLAYNANGGTNAPANSTVTNTSSTYNMIVAHSVFPTREGYGFKGYNTKADGTGTTYYPGSSVSVGPNATVTLYAQWAVNTYTITYNGNGNTGGSTAAQTKNYNVAINLQNNGFTKTGYHFTGWNTAANGTGTAYAAGASYNTNANLTLYAQWAINTYTITYNGNGNTGGSTAAQTKNYNVAINLQNNGFTKTGYHFTGWNTAANGTGTAYAAGANYSANANLTLYAQWAVNTSTLKVKPNGGTWNGSTNEQSFTQNYNTTKSIPVPARTGYTFTGWTRTGTNGTLSSLTAAATYTFGAANSTTDTITAGWKVNNYTVTYIDRIKGTTTQLGTSSTASKPYGSSVRGADKGSDTTVGKYHTGYYYVSDTSATVTTSGATVYRYFSPQNYTVTYIDVVDSRNGKELGRFTAAKPYKSTVRGADKGSSGVDNAYYNGYYYFSDTSATVTTSGATVYRIFKQRMSTIAGNIIWEDWNNKNLSRPSSVNLYINGSDGSKYSYVITGNNSQNTSVNKWPYSKEVPKYDINGKVITYTVSQDTAVSQEEGLAYKDPVVNGYDVTNKITNDGPTLPKTKIPVTITWDDDDNQYGFRPETVTIQLQQNGTVIKTITTSDDYTFTELLKYDENGNKYIYTVQASDEDRYTKAENNSAPYNKSVTYTFIKPAYSVIIPKVVILDGNTGIGEYVVSVNGQIDDRDFVNVIPDKSFKMENDYLSPITAIVKQDRTVFTNKENIKNGAISNGTITTKSLAGRWSGSFNFNIYFEFGR